MSRLGLWLLTLTLLCLSTASFGRGEPLSLGRRDDNLPARVPYVFPPPGTDPIADAIRARRTNGTLLDLDGVLLNVPLLAQAHSNLFGVIRSNSSLPANMRELIILRVVVLSNASYEWIQHEPVARMAGLTTEQLLVIRLAPPFFASQGLNFTSILGADLVAAMTFTDWITQNIRVPDDVFDGLRPFLNDSQLVEAVSTAASYSAGGRLVVALNVDAKMDVPVPIPM
ncbi:putative glycosidase C21B10.07 [Mycena sanguinolenta]|uniref:Putative glycosidase C21B10.07 n=1 Tax=Mycena sanguinolenta TaxID=230812 RepID=A0A8H6U3Y8_9AGAR|nr:putative glycosidase C21B10.07 [Mycena sanguinolenta]